MDAVPEQQRARLWRDDADAADMSLALARWHDALRRDDHDAALAVIARLARCERWDELGPLVTGLWCRVPKCAPWTWHDDATVARHGRLLAEVSRHLVGAPPRLETEIRPRADYERGLTAWWGYQLALRVRNGHEGDDLVPTPDAWWFQERDDTYRGDAQPMPPVPACLCLDPWLARLQEACGCARSTAAPRAGVCSLCAGSGRCAPTLLFEVQNLAGWASRRERASHETCPMCVGTGRCAACRGTLDHPRAVTLHAAFRELERRVVELDEGCVELVYLDRASQRGFAFGGTLERQLAAVDDLRGPASQGLDPTQLARASAAASSGAAARHALLAGLAHVGYVARGDLEPVAPPDALEQLAAALCAGTGATAGTALALRQSAAALLGLCAGAPLWRSRGGLTDAALDAGFVAELAGGRELLLLSYVHAAPLRAAARARA